MTAMRYEWERRTTESGVVRVVKPWRSAAGAAAAAVVALVALGAVVRVCTFAVALAAAGLAATGCQRDEAAAVTDPAAIVFRDDTDALIELRQPARRVVSLSPALTEVLFAVGCGEALVLRDGWSNHPEEALAVPRIDGFSPGAEAVIAARPDLVLASYPPDALRAALRSAGVAFAALSPTGLEGIATGIERVSLACGEPASGLQVAADFRADVAAVKAAVRGRGTPGVYFELDAGGGRPFTIGQGSIGAALLEAAGGRNVFEGGATAAFQVSAEAVLAARPQVVLLAYMTGPPAPDARPLVAGRPGWSSMPAFVSGRIAAVDGDLVSRPAPRLIAGLRTLAKLLHPTIKLPPARSAAATADRGRR